MRMLRQTCKTHGLLGQSILITLPRTMKSGFHRVKHKNEQMRSCVNLKRPVLLDGNKFRLRILFRKPKWFSEPFRKHFKHTKRRGKNHAFLFYFFCPFKLNSNSPPMMTAPPMNVPIPGTSLSRIKLISADSSGDRNIKFATSLVFSA